MSKKYSKINRILWIVVIVWGIIGITYAFLTGKFFWIPYTLTFGIFYWWFDKKLEKKKRVK